MVFKRRLFALLCAVSVMTAMMPEAAYANDNDDIVILFESDVHCEISGYTKLASLKKEAEEKTDYVSVVSCGDFIQGGPIGAVSDGEYIIEIMNAVGYDAAALGNHEFDYTIPRLAELTDMLSAKTLSCNFITTDNSELVYDPYTIISYGDTDVAYIGITTPESISKSTPVYFTDENGEYIYSFCGDNLYETVQNSIDAAKADGADYIVALSHLGTEYVTDEWTAQEVAAHTSGIDVMLDGHSHSVIEGETVPDMNGDDVLISSVGTKFEYIGCLTINSEGEFKTELIETASYEGEDEAVSKVVSNIEAEYSAMGGRIAGQSDVTLTTLDESGNRAVRNAETNIGDFCADAFRIELNADIGIMNGGGIRGDIAAGDVTYNDILGMFPYGNLVCSVEVSGQTVLDMLEHSVKSSPDEAGGFLQVSGVKFNVNTSIDSPVIVDENDMFIEIKGERRVSNVKILNSET
ncbi:MAG: bifunctional metallophosphatase/5'-nucleotidase [Clostridiales bacterium]|nr:bifunctional metallophosphatase/5'-nucleotidase [Clostridiales bacterium]